MRNAVKKSEESNGIIYGINKTEMTKILVLTIIIVLGLSNRIYITGYLKNSNKTKHILTSDRQIILMVKNTIIAETITDSTSYYELDFLDIYNIQDTINIYYLAGVNQQDTILLKSINTFTSNTPKIDLYVPTNPTFKNRPK